MAITQMQDIFDRAQVGKQLDISAVSAATGTLTAAAAGSGGLSAQMFVNAIGFTNWGAALTDFVYQAGITDNFRVFDIAGSTSRALSYFFGRVYKIGTLDLTGTGSRFTHDAATFPLLGTRYGQTNQPVNLIPFMLMTTAQTTTPAVFTMNYTNQDGGSVTGAVTHTMPAASVNIGSCYFLPLEIGDTAVRDISDINVSVAAAAGAATIYGLDPDVCATAIFAGIPLQRNPVVRGFNLANFAPAPATAGTPTTLLTVIGVGSQGSTTIYFNLKAYRDN